MNTKLKHNKSHTIEQKARKHTVKMSKIHTNLPIHSQRSAFQTYTNIHQQNCIRTYWSKTETNSIFTSTTRNERKRSFPTTRTLKIQDLQHVATSSEHTQETHSPRITHFMFVIIHFYFAGEIFSFWVGLKGKFIMEGGRNFLIGQIVCMIAFCCCCCSFSKPMWKKSRNIHLSYFCWLYKSEQNKILLIFC